MEEKLQQNTYEKLQYVQQRLKAPKSQFNSFGKYHYRNCEDILEAVKPINNEIGAAITLCDELVQIGDRYYIKATATFINCSSGEKIETHAFAREEENKKGMDSSQVTGATSSYARKYALNGLLNIDDTKDSDSTNTGEGTKTTTKQEKPVELTSKINEIMALATELSKTDSTSVSTKIKQFVPNGNPHAIKDIEVANKVLAALKA